MRHVLLGLALVGWGCSDDRVVHVDPDAGVDAGPADRYDPTASLFDPDNLVEVEIEIDEDDWDELRTQTRSFFDILGGADCLAQPFPKPFTYFEGTVTVDGQTVENVGVRKKGFLGSLDDVRPSLKIKFDEYLPDQEFLGLVRLTLNNAKQDPSFARQCLTYDFFREVGLPASRCNYARVHVNGRELGLYVNVESVDKRFLKRHFLSNEGNLYEGTLSDFRDGWTDTFEKKTNEMDPDRSDLDALVTAANVEDRDLVSSLEHVLDLDRFFTFWAAEVITAHWDGYAGNTNNYFVYHDPTTGRFTFMPWGVDATFQDPTGPALLAQGFLARRLYLNPDTQDEYLDRLGEMLDVHWDDRALFDAVDRMEYVIEQVTRDAAEPIDELRAFVLTRGDAIRDQLAGGPPPLDQPLRQPPCFEVIGSIDGTFATTFGTLGNVDPWSAGTGTLSVTVNEETPSFQIIGASAGLDTNPEAGDQPQVLLQIVGYVDDGNVDPDDDMILVVILAIPQPAFAPGEVPLNFGGGSYGVLFSFMPSTEEFTPIAMLVLGSATLDEASMIPDAPVEGSFTSDLIPWLF